MLQILQPFQRRFPTTEPEFSALQLALRRMGHILERAPNNVANQLRSAPARAFLTNEPGSTEAPYTPDPWAGGDDPWSHGAGPWADYNSGGASSSNPAAAWQDPASTPAFPAYAADSDTDHDESY